MLFFLCMDYVGGVNMSLRTAYRRCLKSIESVLRGCHWRDETYFGCSDPFEVRPLLLRSVANAADLATRVGLDSNDPLIGSRWKDPRAGWHLDGGLRLG